MIDSTIAPGVTVESKVRPEVPGTQPNHFPVPKALRSFFYSDDVRLNLAINVMRSEPSGDKGGGGVSRFAE